MLKVVLFYLFVLIIFIFISWLYLNIIVFLVFYLLYRILVRIFFLFPFVIGPNQSLNLRSIAGPNNKACPCAIRPRNPQCHSPANTHVRPRVHGFLPPAWVTVHPCTKLPASAHCFYNPWLEGWYTNYSIISWRCLSLELWFLIMLHRGTPCSRGYGGHNGERRRESIRGCIASFDLSVLNLVIVEKGREWSS